MSFIGDALDSLTGGIFSDVTKALGLSGGGGGITIGGIGDLLSGVTSTINSIDSVVSGLATDIQSFISPITGVVDSIANLGKDIEDKVIGPILTPITTTITQIEGLTSTINKLVDQGIGGILQIPKALSDALTGIQKSWDDSTRQLADANAKVASETLVPGIHEAVAPGLKSITDAVLGFTPPQVNDIDQIKAIMLDENFSFDALRTTYEAIIESIKKPTTWPQWFMFSMYQILQIVPYVLGSLKTVEEDASATAWALNPTKLFDPAYAARLFRKGIIAEDIARVEMQQGGFDPTRQSAMFEDLDWLPSPEQAGQWLLRGLITRAEFEQTVTAQGFNAADITAFIEGLVPLVQPQILLDFLARGIVTQQEFDDQMRGQGYSDAQIKQYITGGISPPQVTTLIGARGNQYAGANNFYSSTYASKTPDDIVNAARASRIDEGQAQAMWDSHWSAMPIQMAVNLFFRGHMNRQEVQYVVGQNNYPPDMTDLFISAQQELIAPRTIPALFARGAISEAQARSDLQARGYQDADINLLLDDATTVAASKKKPPPAATTHLTIAEITEAHTDGVITDDQFSTLMTEHGFTSDEIGILGGLNTYKAAKQAKKDQVATLKAEVALGTKTAADVQTELSSAGFTTPEIERVVASIHQAKKQAAKLPSLAEMSSMAKKSIITKDDLLAGIQALGYVAPWDQRLVDLTFTTGAANAGPSTAA